MTCMFRALVCTTTTYLQQSNNIDQLRKVAKPARGQLNGEIKCPCRCIRGKHIYIYMCVLLFALFVYTTGIFFIWGHVDYSCTIHCCIALCIYYIYIYIYICDYYSGMYICMVITYSKDKNQPGKVANPARGQLSEQKK